MTRARSDKRLTIGRRAVAVSIMAEAIREAMRQVELDYPPGVPFDQPAAIAERLVSIAHDSEYKMRSDQLVLTLDASMEAPDRADAMRSTPEDQPPEAPSLA